MNTLVKMTAGSRVRRCEYSSSWIFSLVQPQGNISVGQGFQLAMNLVQDVIDHGKRNCQTNDVNHPHPSSFVAVANNS